MIYKERYKVELEDIGRENKIDNKRIVTIMEDIAGSHSDKVGLGVSASAINKKAWVLLDWKIKILKRPAYNEYIDASTWSRKSDRLCAFRDFELYDQNGELCAIGTSRWLYMDLVRRRPIILDNKMNDIYGTETEKNVFDEEIKKIELPDLDNLPDNIMVTEKPYLIQRRDIDINGHLHNVSYLVQTSFERDIDMYMEAVKGSPLSLTAVTGQFSASISGSEVTKALKQPADYEDVKSKLIMTGNTGYKVSGIELHMDNDVFLSVGELKKLRREVIAQLDNNILSSYCRTYKEPDDSIINPCYMTYNEQDNSILSSDCDAHNEHNNNCTGIESQYNDVSDNAGKMLCTVYCHSFDIVSSVIDIVSSPDNKLDIAVGRIYLDFGMYYSDWQRFIKVCEKINKMGIKLFIALPYILEQSRARQLSAMLDDIEHNTGIIIDGYLVRNIEEIGLIGSRKSKVKDIITDTGLYVFNKYAGYELKDIADKAGVRLLSHTLPLELNNSELQDTLTAGSEIIVYGKIPAMVSKSCVRKTYGICDKKCSTTLLKQGSDVSYIVESVCSYCYTVTWAGTFDLTEELKRNDLGVRSLRFEFIDEDTFTIKKALSFEGVSPYKGHFYRGVN